MDAPNPEVFSELTNALQTIALLTQKLLTEATETHRALESAVKRAVVAVHAMRPKE